jgi:serine/threonine protein kinase
MAQFCDIVKIGKGGYGDVFSAVHAQSRAPVVLKVLEAVATGPQKELLARELWCLNNLHHRHLVHTAGAVARELSLPFGTFLKADGTVVIVQEHANAGDLFDMVTSARSGYLAEAQVRTLLIQLLQSVRYLHESGVAHLDIKPENILLHRPSPFSDPELRLADFGLCRVSEYFGDDIHAVAKPRGTLAYMAPEMFFRNHTFGGTQADMWAVGICLFIMLTGRPPLTVAKPNCSERFDLLNDGDHGAFWSRIDKQQQQRYCRRVLSPEAKDLVSKLLDVDPTSRFAAGDALKHPFCSPPTRPPLPVDAAAAAVALVGKVRGCMASLAV